MFSHRFDNKPVWYIAKSKSWGNTIRKHGVSKHISIRKNQYVTTNPDKVEFTHVLCLNNEDMKQKGVDLYQLDSHFFPRWVEGSGLSDCHVSRGGGTEFYDCENHHELVKNFLDSIGIRIIGETTDDSEFPLITGLSRTDMTRFHELRSKEDIDRMNFNHELQVSLSKHNDLLHKFKDIFLDGGDLRPYQRELWEIWCNQIRTNKKYNGIIQWPTGSGKTIGELILLVLLQQHYASQGKPYRAVIICPKNDILDTQMKHILKLKEFGMEVFEGHNGKLSSLTLPNDKSIILTATHASFTQKDIFDKLPEFDHVHYDEVHRITGKEFTENLLDWLPKWGTQYLTGTSATPFTSYSEQQQQITKIFGGDLSKIHHTDVNTLIRLGYIAKPRFTVNIIRDGNKQEIIEQLTNVSKSIIEQRLELNMMRGGKIIIYLPLIEYAVLAKECADNTFPVDWKCYIAKEDAPPLCSDREFISAPADGTPRVLYACEKYREGSDIQGLEATIPLMGKTMASHILLQIIGRALRKDYDDKEGWCCIVKTQQGDETEDDVFNNIMLNLVSYLNIDINSVHTHSKKQMSRIIKEFFGDITKSDGSIMDIDDTIRRIQNMYNRRIDITYEEMRDINRTLKLSSKKEYIESEMDNPHYISKPIEHFRSKWNSWYDYLGIDTSKWPSTKCEWKEICKEKGLITWDTYKINYGDELPPNPTEMYNDFTNWRDEFPEGTQDEDDW